MRIRPKESGLSIGLNFDKKNFLKFKSQIIKLGKQLEHQSKSTNYSWLCHGQINPYIECKGWDSRVIDKQGRVSSVIFLDYDNILFKLMEAELLYLIKKWKLTPFYIFKTFEDKDENGDQYGNYHAICLTKLNFSEVIQLQNETSCDVNYKQVPQVYRFKTWVLRLGDKEDKGRPKYKCIIVSEDDYIDKTKLFYGEYDQAVSEFHLRVLINLYPNLPEVYYGNLDGNIKGSLVKYMTASK